MTNFNVNNNVTDFTEKIFSDSDDIPVGTVINIVLKKSYDFIVIWYLLWT